MNQVSVAKLEMLSCHAKDMVLVFIWGTSATLEISMPHAMERRHVDYLVGMGRRLEILRTHAKEINPALNLESAAKLEVL